MLQFGAVQVVEERAYAQMGAVEHSEGFRIYGVAFFMWRRLFYSFTGGADKSQGSESGPCRNRFQQSLVSVVCLHGVEYILFVSRGPEQFRCLTVLVTLPIFQFMK